MLRNPGATGAELLIAEYNAVRSEILHGLQAGQSILNWSLATFGVLFGAGLVAMSAKIPKAYAAPLDYAILILFEVVLPGFLIAVAWQWCGEVHRLERAGAYLRGLERRTASIQVASATPRKGVLGWETFLNGPGHSEKSAIPYAGTIAMLSGAFLAPAAVYIPLSFRWIDENSGSIPLTIILIAAPVILTAGYVTVCVYVHAKTQRLAKRYWDFTTRQLELI